MKELKKERLKIIFPVVCILWGVALLCLFSSLPDIRAAIDSEPVLLSEVDFSEDVDGLYVTGTLSAIYDCYYESSSLGIADSKKYIINADDAHYMGFHANLPKDIPDCDNLQEITFSYLAGELSDAILADSSLNVTGRLEKMSDEHLKQYHDYLHWDVMPAKMQERYLPYYLNLNATDSELEVLLMTSLLPFIIGCIILLRTLAGCGQKAVRKYIKNSQNPMYTRAKIEQFLQMTPKIHDLQYNRDFICNLDGTVFRETKDLIWFYEDVVLHKVNFIPTGKSYRLILAFSDGTQEVILLSTEDAVLFHIDRLKSLCPDALCGYSEYAERRYKELTQSEGTNEC